MLLYFDLHFRKYSNLAERAYEIFNVFLLLNVNITKPKDQYRLAKHYRATISVLESLHSYA